MFLLMILLMVDIYFINDSCNLSLLKLDDGLL